MKSSISATTPGLDKRLRDLRPGQTIRWGGGPRFSRTATKTDDGLRILFAVGSRSTPGQEARVTSQY